MIDCIVMVRRGVIRDSQSRALWYFYKLIADGYSLGALAVI